MVIFCLTDLKLMSTLSIEPLHISGVAIPTNFLDSILGQSIDYTKLVYPMDLATNPQYCHAIQFSVHDYTYPLVESEFQKFAGKFYETGAQLGKKLNTPIPNMSNTGTVGDNFGQVWSSMQQSITNSNFVKMGGALGNELSSAFNAGKNFNLSSPINTGINAVNSAVGQAPADIEQFVTQYGPLAQPGTYRPQVNERALAYVSLYMPDTLTTQVQSKYDEISATDTFGILGYTANMISDALKNKSPVASNPASLFNDDYLRGSVAGAAGMLTNKTFGSMLGNALKRVPNPQVQLLYRGLDLRSFQFDFIFTPASPKEAEEVDEIIKTFTYYSLPDVTAGSGNQYFIPPQIFRIKFSFLGDDTISGQIYDIFKQNMTNVFGNQFTKIASGSNPTEDISAKTKNAKLFNIGDCILEGVQVNYAPLGTWASYSDGYPIQTTLSLTFKEMNLINKSTPGIQPKDTSAYSASKNNSNLGFTANPDVKSMFSGVTGGQTLTDISGGNNLYDYLYGK